MSHSAHVVAQHSYARCLRAPDFFSGFYARLLESDPAIPPMFADTEFPRQHKLLQHALGLLLSYANRPDGALLDRLAAKHSKNGIDVPPRFYDLFLEALMGAIRTHDPRFDEDVAAAWRDALRPGVDYMIERYDP